MYNMPRKIDHYLKLFILLISLNMFVKRIKKKNGFWFLCFLDLLSVVNLITLGTGAIQVATLR